MNHTLFFPHIRESLFAGSMTQQQVDGINRLMEVWEEVWDPELPWSAVRIDQFAYVLATVYHETARAMWPVREHGGAEYFRRMYDMEGDRPHVAQRLGNTQPGDGCRFHGRGDVQLTGRDNYQRQGTKLGLDLIHDPDLMLKPDVSAQVLIRGMIDGDFTGHGLGDFINATLTDYANARRIINGTDKAGQIAGYAGKFRLALSAAKEPPQPPPVKPAPAVKPKPIPAPVQEAEPVAAPPEVDPFARRTPSIDPPMELPEEPEPVRSPLPSPERRTERKASAVRRTSDKVAGWKTHAGMAVSMVIGVAGMLGYVPGMTPDTGAQMIQAAFGVSGFRSALPRLIKMGIEFYLLSKNTRGNNE